MQYLPANIATILSIEKAPALVLLK